MGSVLARVVVLLFDTFMTNTHKNLFPAISARWRGTTGTDLVSFVIDKNIDNGVISLFSFRTHTTLSDVNMKFRIFVFKPFF